MLWGLEEGAKTKRVTENVWEAEALTATDPASLSYA